MPDNKHQPAFPGLDPRGINYRPASGMSKREWFAAHALVGILANKQHLDTTCAVVADEAIDCADALLNKLEETEGGA